MPSPIFKDVVNFILNFDAMRCQNMPIFMEVSMLNIVRLTAGFLDMARFTTLTSLSSLFSCEHLCPVFDVKISSRPFCIEISEENFHVVHRKCPLNHKTYP